MSVHSAASTATLHEPQAIMDAGAGYMSRSMCLLDTGPLKGRLLLAAWDHGITQVADNVATMLQEATQVRCMLVAVPFLILYFLHMDDNTVTYQPSPLPLPICLTTPGT